jgi:hypothetical protein
MIEIQDYSGRLIVVMPMRVRHAGTIACVIIDGRKVADFPTMTEAARHARSLAQGRYEELAGPPCVD